MADQVNVEEALRNVCRMEGAVHQAAGQPYPTASRAHATPSDPLGTRPDPTSFAAMIEGVVDARIEQRIRGRVAALGNVSDMVLVQELLARGWAVFRPLNK